MKTLSLALAAIALVSVSSAVWAQTDTAPATGRLHRIDIKAKHPKAYHPAIGDLVQCYLDFPVVPEQIVENLRVTTAGRSLSVIGVVGTSKPRIVGSGQISLYLMPRQTGQTTVTILPTIPGQKPDPIAITFRVAPERRREP